MSSPSLTDYFATDYNVYSIRVEKLTIPQHFDSFEPDAPNDTGCRAVIMPSPRKGAHNYVKDGKFLLIGIYRDTGRSSTSFPLFSNLIWWRGPGGLTINHDQHEAVVGDEVFVYNTNMTAEQQLTVTAVLNETQFQVQTNALSGASSGNAAAYRLNKLKNWYEENVVFRIFPSFKLVPYADILAIFDSTDPNNTQEKRYLRNITLDQTVMIPSALNQVTDYTPATSLSKISDISSSLPKITVISKTDEKKRYEYDQVFDENGVELPLRYADNGTPIDPMFYDLKSKNRNLFITSPQVNESPDSGSGSLADAKAWVYDYYGYLINDTTRGPYLDDEIITRDPAITTNYNNILIKQQSSTYMYPPTSPIFDTFANEVGGILENNTLVVYKQRTPLELDFYGRPKKQSTNPPVYYVTQVVPPPEVD